ncbi:tetratricopeptide repeat protein [Treponema denticola]|uniref:Tetratricopeptide repeat protein n=1 Tax=Treponema denticola TaxID=158 RepID=A0A9Q9BJR7_TREDN|nr:tetratricopeptide repeat protein [Treponema denticola]UTC89224.1 tetratricopeptide repeat protein [Treponema denticola]UTD01420.1 tetratricopeptide repeat protein [Treponema denticola]
MAKSVNALINEAIEAGKKRDYKTSILILENLAAEGLAEVSSPFYGEKKGNPEIYLYLSRAWAAVNNYGRAIAYGKAYVKRCSSDSASANSDLPMGFFFLGRSYLAAGQYDRAVYCLEKSLKLNPHPLETRAMLGSAYLKWKKPRLARETFEEALKFAPSDTKLNAGYLNSLFVEGVYELRNGNADMARQMFSFAIKNGIDGVAPRLYLAHALKMEGYLPEALGQYEAACEFEPDDPALKWYPAMIKMQLGDAAGAAEDFAKLGIEIPDDGVSDRFFAMGVIKKHMERGDYSRAAVAARIFIKTFGSDAEIRLLAAEAQRSMGNTNTALGHYKCALEHEPENPYPHYGIMLALQEAYRWEELSAAILRAEASGVCDADDIYYYKIITAAHIDNPPEEVLPHIQALIQNGRADSAIFNAMGCCYIKLNMPDLALNWYERALSINEKDEEAKIGIIASYENLQLHKEADEAYNSYLNEWGKNIYIRRDYVLFLEKCERWEDAGNQLEILMSQGKKVNFDPDLALFRRKAGQYQKAAILYRKMLRAKPEERLLLHNLVFCLDKMGQTKVALDLLKAAEKMFGIKTDSMLIKGILQMRLKKKEEAIKTFQYILEKEPKNKHAAEFLEKAYGK